MTNSGPDQGKSGGQRCDYVGRDLEAMSDARNYYAWMLSEFSPFLGANGAEIGAGSGYAAALIGMSEAAFVKYEEGRRRFFDR